MIMCNDFREEGGDYRKCHGTPHHIITTTGAADRTFTHIDITYTLFHSLSTQNFDLTRVKASWFTKESFCKWLCRYTCGNVLVFYTFFFSDEARLHLHGYINMQHYWLWSSENHHVFWTTSLHTQRIGVWYATSCKCVGGPISSETAITAKVYRDII